MNIETETTQTSSTSQHDRYARAIAASKRARWAVEDVLGDRTLGRDDKFLPDGLSKVHRLEFLSDDERRFLSRIQGRTYANVFGLVERFINAKVLELSAHYYFGDQTALEALVRFSDEELKHQELFRRVERLCADVMPEGYTFGFDPNEVAGVVLGKSTWAVLALTCLIELYTQTHYVESIAVDDHVSPLFKEVFRAHWMEESQHAKLDELEWRAEDKKLTGDARTRAVTDLIELVGAVDSILQSQAAADAVYFVRTTERELSRLEIARIHETLVVAYRYQYILSGVERTRFPSILEELVGKADFARVVAALAPLAADA